MSEELPEGFRLVNEENTFNNAGNIPEGFSLVDEGPQQLNTSGIPEGFSLVDNVDPVVNKEHQVEPEKFLEAQGISSEEFAKGLSDGISSATNVPEESSINQISNAPEEKGIVDKAVNIGAGFAERSNQLVGNLIGFSGTLDKSAASVIDNIAFALIGDSEKSERFKQKWNARREYNEKNAAAFADSFRKTDYFKYKEGVSTEDIKTSYKEGGLLNTDLIAKVAEYGIEQGVKSIPDMVAMSYVLPAYLLSRSEEMATDRAKNKGKESVEMIDVLESAPFVAASVFLDKIGFGASTKKFKEKAGEEILKAGFKYAADRMAKEGLKAGATEAGTEFFQEGVIEYIGERFGTEAEISIAEGFERGAFAALAAGPSAGTMGAIGQATQESFKKKIKDKITAAKKVTPDSGAITEEAIPEGFVDDEEATPGVTPEAIPGVPTESAQGDDPFGDFEVEVEAAIPDYSADSNYKRVFDDFYNIGTQMNYDESQNGEADLLTPQEMKDSVNEHINANIESIDKHITEYNKEAGITGEAPKKGRIKAQDQSTSESIMRGALRVGGINVLEGDVFASFDQKNKYGQESIDKAIGALSETLSEAFPDRFDMQRDEPLSWIRDNFGDDPKAKIFDTEMQSDKILKDESTPYIMQAIEEGLSDKAHAARIADDIIGDRKSIRVMFDGDTYSLTKTATGDVFINGGDINKTDVTGKTIHVGDYVKPKSKMGMSAPVEKYGELIEISDVKEKWSDDEIDLRVDDGKKFISLSSIQVPKDKRSNGIGSKIMNDIISVADNKGKTIVLTPSADFGGSVPRLKKFYKSFGFVENKGRNKDYEISDSMYREAVIEKPSSKMGMDAPKKQTTPEVKSVENLSITEFRKGYRTNESLKRFTIPDGEILTGPKRIMADAAFDKKNNQDGTTTYTRKKTEKRTPKPISKKVSRIKKETPVLIDKKELAEFSDKKTLQDGDWVSLSKEYAHVHGKSRFGEGKYRIIEQEVAPSALWWDGNDINEWGYGRAKPKKYSFRDQHQAPSFDPRSVSEKMEKGGDFSLDEVAEGNHIQPDDYFDSIKGPDLYSYNTKSGIESYSTITNVIKSKANGGDAGKVTAYRSVPISEKLKPTPKKAPVKKFTPPKKSKSTKLNVTGTDQPMPNYQMTFSSLGMPERPSNNMVSIGNKEIKLRPEDNPTRREGIQAQVESIIGPRLYTGNIQNKSALGTYDLQNSEVRTKNYYDVEVLAHEMAHFLDFHYKYKSKFKKAIAADFTSMAEVSSLSYTSQKDLVDAEGFAEYVRLWLTQYDKAADKAPNFTEVFEDILKNDKSLNNKMKLLQADMHRWYNQGDMARLEAKTSGNKFTKMQRLTRMLNRKPGDLWRQHYIDAIHAAKVIGTDINGKMLDAREDAFKNLQLQNGVDGIFEQSVKYGAPTFNNKGVITFKGPSLESIFGKSVNHSVRRLRKHEQYFASRRAQETTKQGRENLLTDGEIKAGLKYGEENPYFKESFNDYQEYNKNMMNFYVECGYLTRDSANKILSRNKNYAPAHRAMDKDSGRGATSEGFQRLTGGGQNQVHMYDNIMKQDLKHLQSALKRRALRMLYSQGLKSPKGSKWFSEIPSSAKPATEAVEEMVKKSKKMIKELGIDSETLMDGDIEEYFESNPDELTFWSFGNKPKTSETMVDSFIDEEGKTRWIEINKDNYLLPDMLDALDGLTMPDGALGTAIKAAMKIKQFQTLTITAMAQFAGPNIVRDQKGAFVLSGGTYRPIIDTGIGFYEYMKSFVTENSLFDEMKAQGGPGGGRVSTFLESDFGFADAKSYKGKKPFYHPAEVANNLLDIYMNIADAAEMATRIGFYSRLVSQGVNPREAAFQSREISTDFAKHGSYSAFVASQRTVPFFGAYIQSVDRDLRGMFERNGKIRMSNMFKNPNGERDYSMLKAKMIGISTTYIATNILLSILGRDEERYKELTPDQKTRFNHYFIFDKHYTTPKGHGLIALAGSVAEGVVDYVNGEEFKNVSNDILFAIAYHFGADAMPGALSPFVDIAFNETFTGAPIIGRYAESRSAKYQFSDRTPQLYVKIGKGLGISPDKARHIVRGYTGYIEEIVAENTEAYLWDYDAWGERPNKKSYVDMISKQFIPKEVPYRTKYTTGYYDLKRRATEAKANFSFGISSAYKGKKVIEEVISDKVQKTFVGLDKLFKGIDSALKSMSTGVSAITYNKNLTGDEKIEKIENLYKQKNSTLKTVYFEVTKELNKIEKEIKEK